MALALALDIIVFNVTANAAFALPLPSSARPCPVRGPCHSPLAQTTELTLSPIEIFAYHRKRLDVRIMAMSHQAFTLARLTSRSKANGTICTEPWTSKGAASSSCPDENPSVACAARRCTGTPSDEGPKISVLRICLVRICLVRIGASLPRNFGRQVAEMCGMVDRHDATIVFAAFA
jgi:hypothetical protein